MNKIKVASIPVVNASLSSELNWKDIRVDRKNQLGNPYWMEHEHQRDLVIKMYRKYLWEAIKDFQNNPDAKVRYKEDLFPNLKNTKIQIASTYRAPKTIEVIQQLNYIIKQLEYSNVRLLCWCAPAPCHGDVIVSCINWMMRSKGQS